MSRWINKNIGWVLVGSAAVVAGTILILKKPASASPPPLVPPMPDTTPAPGPIVIPQGQTPTVVTLVPNVPAGTVTVKLGSFVTIQLPAGATWVSNNGAAMSGAAAIQWAYVGPGIVTLKWLDASGLTQTTALSFVTG